MFGMIRLFFDDHKTILKASIFSESGEISLMVIVIIIGPDDKNNYRSYFYLIMNVKWTKKSDHIQWLALYFVELFFRQNLSSAHLNLKKN
jgi:hypothetical protein